MGIFTRGSTLWIRFRGVDGKWRNTTTGYAVGQEALAQAVLDGVLARVRGASPGEVVTVGPETVRAFAEPWIVKRRELDLDWKNDEGRLRLHVLPVIGDMRIADVRTRHIVDLFHGIRTNTARPVAQRTVYNIYSVVAALFRDAKLADRIEQTPCCLDERQLGPLVDKDRGWRAGAVFARDEVQTIISDERIPFDRRIVYGLEFLAGVRHGEASALRWEHHEPQMKPLGRLLVANSYNTRKGKEKGTKTDAERHVPVHPTLAAMLAEWKLHGWESMVGRAPTPDDLIVPLPPDVAARRRSREGEPFRGHDYSGKRWRDDLETLELRHRRGHDARATFITLALDDGADPHIIESRVTHTKPQRSAFDGYNRSRQWAIVCGEVAKLKISRVTAPVEQQAVSAAVTGAVTAAASAEDDSGKEWRRRESNATGSMLHVVPRSESRHDAPREFPPSVSAAPVAVTSPVTGLAAALATAVLEGDRHRARKLAIELRALLSDGPVSAKKWPAARPTPGPVTDRDGGSADGHF